MISKKIKMISKSGLDVKSAGMLIKVIQPFESEVVLAHDDRRLNARSVLGLLSAGIKDGEDVEFICTGTDENECMRVIEKALTAGLEE